MREPVSLRKFLFGFIQASGWMKVFHMGICLTAIGFVGLTIYRAYFMPTNTTNIVAQPGSHVTMQQPKGRFEIAPYVKGYVFVESDERQGYGAETGIQIKF